MTSSPDQLHISGTLQAETALAALSTTGMNPAAQKLLETCLGVYRDLRTSHPDYPDTFDMQLEGDSTEAMKADIILGLELLASGSSDVPQKLAAQALLEVLTK